MLLMLEWNFFFFFVIVFFLWNGKCNVFKIVEYVNVFIIYGLVFFLKIKKKLIVVFFKNIFEWIGKKIFIIGIYKKYIYWEMVIL